MCQLQYINNKQNKQLTRELHCHSPFMSDRNLIERRGDISSSSDAFVPICQTVRLRIAESGCNSPHWEWNITEIRLVSSYLWSIIKPAKKEATVCLFSLYIHKSAVKEITKIGSRHFQKQPQILPYWRSYVGGRPLRAHAHKCGLRLSVDSMHEWRWKLSD